MPVETPVVTTPTEARTDALTERTSVETSFRLATTPMPTRMARIRRRGAGRGARRTVMLERSWTWQDYAACRDAPAELFFGPEGEKPQERDQRERRAVQVCATCPVLEACQMHAMTLPEAYGVWGGTTEAGRKSGRRREPSPAA